MDIRISLFMSYNITKINVSLGVKNVHADIVKLNEKY